MAVQESLKSLKKHFYDKNGIVSKIDSFLKNAQKMIDFMNKNNVTGVQQSLEKCEQSLPQMLSQIDITNLPDEMKTLKDTILDYVLNLAYAIEFGDNAYIEQLRKIANEYINTNTISDGMEKEIESLQKEIQKQKWDVKQIRHKFNSAIKMI